MDQKTETDVSTLFEEFEQVIEDLKGVPNLDRFREEYEHLLNALKASKERTDQYMASYNQLKEGLLFDSYGIETALKQTESDEVLKKNLMNQIESVKKLIEGLKDRDTKNQERIQTLKSNIATVNNTIKNWQLLNNGNDEFNDQVNAIEALKLDRDLLIQKKTFLSEQLEDIKAKDEQKFAQLAELEEAINQKTNKIQKDQKKLEEQEKTRNREITHIETLKKEKNDVINQRNQMMEKRKELKKLIDKQYGFKIETTKYLKNLEKQVEFQMKHEREFVKRFDESNYVHKKLNEQIEERQVEVTTTIASVTKEETKLADTENLLLEHSNTLEKKKEDLNLENTKLANLKNNVYSLENKYNELEGNRLDERKKIANLERETGLLRELLNKLENNKYEQSEEIFKRTKEIELNESYKNQLEKQIQEIKADIAKVNKEKESHIATISTGTSKLSYYEDELKLKAKVSHELKKQLNELEQKLKEQHTLFEGVKTDRFLYAKQLREKQTELEEFKGKLKNLNTQINHLKEGLDHKEATFQQENQKVRDLERNLEFGKRTRETLSLNLEEREKYVKSLKERIEKCKMKMKDLDKEKQTSKTRLDTVVSERDTLSIQIFKRTEEINLYTEKLKIQQSMLEKTKYQYEDRLKSVMSLRETCKALLHEIKNVKGQVEKIPEVFVDYKILEKEYFTEKLKANVLEEELKNPVNVHRWRNLESTDSKTFDLIKKIQTLQKRLLLKNDELLEKQNIVKEKEAEIAKLKDQLKKQPSLIEVEFSNKLRDTIAEKDKQMVKLEEELNRVKNIHFEADFEYKRLSEELRDLKLKYSEIARESTSKMRSDKENNSTQKITIAKPQKVFTGGGFKVK